MKRMIVSAVLIAALVVGVKAQEIKWGVKAGLNLTTAGKDLKDVMKDGDFDQKTKVGFHIGAFLDWGLTENFYIQPGLYYANKGVKFENKEDDSYKTKVNLSYLELPILASYRFSLSDNIKWHVNAGPYLAYGIGGKFKYEGEEGDEKEDAFGTGEDEAGLKRFDFGLSFGTGVSFNAIYVGVKYDLGLTNIADKDSWDDTKIKNRNFAVSVGYTF
ncbi:porin family protein [Culturomica massiliensis]|uniref:porin family protein n=1 Tax=Culturomica massiliensis TaxID=1841857 RepID=UPI00033E4BD3|nr:porin family protein [uncultured Culturomica sp.]CCZ07238.1 putative uncharacterized protein [Odoribacter sp. CAG:788]